MNLELITSSLAKENLVKSSSRPEFDMNGWNILKYAIFDQEVHQTSLSDVAISPTETTEGERGSYQEISLADYRLLHHHQMVVQVMDSSLISISAQWYVCSIQERKLYQTGLNSAELFPECVEEG